MGIPVSFSFGPLRLAQPSRASSLRLMPVWYDAVGPACPTVAAMMNPMSSVAHYDVGQAPKEIGL